MAYKVIVNKRGAKRLLDILGYLEENWGKKAAEDFLDKLNRMLTILEGRPFIGSPLWQTTNSEKNTANKAQQGILPCKRKYSICP
jgi:plasmid stabilization system protein ParE